MRSTLMYVLLQEGQNDVDKGGWTIVSEDLIGTGKAAVEYKSGIGNF